MNKLMDFLYESNSVPNILMLSELISATLADFGAEYFTMAKVMPQAESTNEKESNFGLMINYPREWCERYFNKHYIEHDPVYKNILTYQGPFFWECALKKHSDKTAHLVMNEAKEFGLSTGVGFAFYQPRGRIIGFSFSSAHQDMRRDKSVLRNLNLFSFQCYQVYSDLILESEICNQEIILTRRELEVLNWISVGKSKTEIANIFGISESCIKRHCENIFTKLRVNSLAFAVAKAIKLNLINPC